MALNDVKIIKITNGLERPAPVEDSTSALVMGGVAVSGKVQLNTPYLMYSIEDAKAIGVDANYDTTNTLLVYHHVLEYFRLAAGQPLYLYLVSQSTTLTNMVDNTSTNGLEALRIATQGKIRQVAVALSPITGYTVANTNGIATDVQTAIPKAQALADAAFDLHEPMDIILEGRDFDATAISTCKDLRDFDAENVSVVIAQDYTIAASNTLHQGYAAVGAYLGMVAASKVANSPAEVGVDFRGNIQNLAAAKFLNYGMGYKKLAQISLVNQGLLYDRHYVTLRIFSGIQGVYFAQSFTCAADTNDLIFIELSRVYNKADREIYKVYVPYINTTIRLTQLGYIPAEVAKALENIGNNLFTQMEARGEISKGKCKIDPRQNILVTRKLEVRWDIIPLGKLENIEGELRFKVSLN